MHPQSAVSSPACRSAAALPSRKPPLLRRSRQGISGAVRAYLELHDRPVGTAQQEEEAALAGMSPEEQKR